MTLIQIARVPRAPQQTPSYRLTKKETPQPEDYRIVDAEGWPAGIIMDDYCIREQLRNEGFTAGDVLQEYGTGKMVRVTDGGELVSCE